MMRNMNLLPQVPFLTKHIRVLMLSAVGVLLLGAAGLFGAAYIMGITAESKEAEASQMRLQAAFWQERHAQDPRMQLFESYKATAEQLIAARTDWVDRIESITSDLPGAARIVELDTDKEALTELSLQFPGMEEAAAYLAELQLNSDVAAFDIVHMAKRELPVRALPSSTGKEPEPDTEVPDVPRPSETYYEDLLEELSRAEDENEALLNELQWMFEQEIAESSFGIQLPELPSASGSRDANWEGMLDSSDRGAITAEDYEAARARWDAYIAQRDNLAQMDRDREANMESEPADSEAETGEETITVYEVTIVLSWTPAAGTEGAKAE